MNRFEVMVWAPDRVTFLKAMQRLKLPDGRPLLTMFSASTGEFAEGLIVDEIGPIVDEEPVYDNSGDEPVLITPAKMIEGHHVNILIVEPMIAALGLAEGASVADRIRKTGILGDVKESRKKGGVPAGFSGKSKIRMYDVSSVKNRTRDWQ